MNAKLCKKLRRVARDCTVGKPERRLMQDNQVRAHGGGVVNDPQTTRGAYRDMKRTVRGMRK